ncbi:MAG: ATP phosphoribosyltransferase regulatory subunit [Methylococcaceae bacterium]
MQNDAWLLPDGIDEMLPDEARRLEILRAKLLKTFELWGYELVVPPFIDFLDSLLTGSGHELDLQTFKLTDQISGKMLGVRADMTPQVARIDAHNLKNNHPTRLCYVGTILHTRGDALEKSRSPMQIGAELYGHAGKESDLEVIRLMLEMLAISGVLNVHLDLGHVGIYRALAEEAALTQAQESELFDVLQRKARPELKDLLESYNLTVDLKTALLKLPELNGDKTILAKARELFKSANAQKALDDLDAISTELARYFPALSISFDLAELRGYHYHTGVVFAAFVPSIGKEIARGGRYDNIGAIFGRERPATGFSADLKVLTALNKQNGIEQPERELIFAPYVDDVSLCEMIRDCRAQNRAVVQQLPNQIGGAKELNCTAFLVKNSEGVWVVESI